ncbi:phage holin family protein [Ralstonia pickettii]|nr:phage holin family protein [Ralstonia pickettii]
MMEFINEYLIQEALVVIPVLLILGTFIKGTPRVKDWTIPYILLFIGVIITVAMLGFNVDAIIQGVLVSGAAVFGNQLYKQAKDK